MKSNMIIEISETDKAYIAGILDGEGCISLTDKKQKNRRGIVCKLVIANTNKDILLWLKNIFGGYLDSKGKKSSYNSKYCYSLQLSYSKCINFINTIYPYIRIKKEQADIILEYQKYVMNPKDGCRKGLSSDFLSKRLELKNRIHILNKRGTN